MLILHIHHGLAEGPASSCVHVETWTNGAVTMWKLHSPWQTAGEMKQIIHSLFETFTGKRPMSLLHTLHDPSKSCGPRTWASAIWPYVQEHNWKYLLTITNDHCNGQMCQSWVDSPSPFWPGLMSLCSWMGCVFQLSYTECVTEGTNSLVTLPLYLRKMEGG